MNILMKLILTHFVLAVAGVIVYKVIWDNTENAPAWATLILGTLVMLLPLLVTVFMLLAIWI